MFDRKRPYTATVVGTLIFVAQGSTLLSGQQSVPSTIASFAIGVAGLVLALNSFVKVRRWNASIQERQR
jgi:hypothetical protein